jgi:hypothetical protein
MRDILFQLRVETYRGERQICTFMAETVIDETGAFAIIRDVYDEEGMPVPFTEVSRVGRRMARIKANQMAKDVYASFGYEY